MMRKEACTTDDAEAFTLTGISSQVHNCVFGCDDKYNALKESNDELKHKYNESFKEVQSCRSSLELLEEQ